MIRTKGVFVLLEACYLLKQKKPNFICQFVGPWYENLENEFFQKVNDYKLSNHVQYLGPKYGSEKDQAFKNAHIFVFPTYSECFPLVTLEAMSYGLPVVSTTEGAIPEIIRNGIDGFTVEKNNPTKLANCLEKLLENEEIYKNMSASARERYQQNYTEAHFAKHFINIINHITKNK
jgi:glycosyltransferase involved in cell wall biosynthesis